MWGKLFLKNTKIILFENKAFFLKNLHSLPHFILIRLSNKLKNARLFLQIFIVSWVELLSNYLIVLQTNVFVDHQVQKYYFDVVVVGLSLKLKLKNFRRRRHSTPTLSTNKWQMSTYLLLLFVHFYRRLCIDVDEQNVHRDRVAIDRRDRTRVDSIRVQRRTDK